MNTFFCLVVVIALFDINSVKVVLANDTIMSMTPIDYFDYSSSTMSMTPIDSDKNNMDIIQGISEISIDPSCSYNAVDNVMNSVPNTMFTIFPSDNNDEDGITNNGSGNNNGGVTVETSPANLVTVRYEYGTLYFEWNTDVSSIATYGGVRIGVPSNQLLNVRVRGGHIVQILNGFTKINTLDVMHTNAAIYASFNTTVVTTSTFLELNNFGGYMYVKTNIPVDYSYIQGGGQSYIETPSYNLIEVSGVDSKLHINGDVDVNSYSSSQDGGSISDNAQLTVTGKIIGTITSRDDSTVNAPSCDNVTSVGGSTCNAGPQKTDVDNDLSQYNIQTLNGTRGCEDGTAMDLSSSASATSFTQVCSSGMVIAAAAAAAAAATAMLI